MRSCMIKYSPRFMPFRARLPERTNMKGGYCTKYRYVIQSGSKLHYFKFMLEVTFFHDKSRLLNYCDKLTSIFNGETEN